ncbi:hypothetical protein F8O09_06515 [Pseudoclavibacter sp. CFCC 11306]|nr:hypothetical protein F8O09_06515 [Pseudoclavibacter sp. CFCC 11306]
MRGRKRFVNRQTLRAALSALTAIGAVLMIGVPTATADELPQSEAQPRTADFQAWDSAADFSLGERKGVEIDRNETLSLTSMPEGRTSYADPFADHRAAVEYETGTWTSPVHDIGFEASDAIVSWNATTPTGTWVQSEMRGRHADGTWTDWFVMGRWASGMDFAAGDIHRTSVDGQSNADGDVYTDTFSAADGRPIVSDQARVTLLRPVGALADVSVSLVSVVASRLGTGTTTTSTSSMTEDTVLDVPQLSQEIHRGEYPEFDNGGEAWCSPTSSSMVLGYWKKGPTSADLQSVTAPNGDPQVDWAAMHTYDFAYEGAGNWPFNTAYSASFGLKSFVTRMPSLAEAETYIAAGIPLVVSVAFTRAELPQAGYSTNGHLLVIVGFTAAGDVIVNDPYSPTNQDVRRIYPRANFERVWLNGSNGTAYVTLPQGHPLPGEASPVSPTTPTDSDPANPEPSPAGPTAPAVQQNPVPSAGAEDQQGVPSSSVTAGDQPQQLAQTGSDLAAWRAAAAVAAGVTLAGLFTAMVGRHRNVRRRARGR